MDVLERVGRPLTMKQISDETGVSLSTVYRIVRTLSAHGCLPEHADKTYSLRRIQVFTDAKESQESGRGRAIPSEPVRSGRGSR